MNVLLAVILDEDNRRTITGNKLKGVELMPSALVLEEPDDVDEAA